LRAGASTITSGQLTTEMVMDERSRELYWEGLRRPDLIRHNKFVSGTYLWPFKGGAANGTSVSDHLKLFPIPEDVLLVNPNIKQNPNY
jgi:sugar lactone lactonase YvrE